MSPAIGVVAIGRNEGERLVRSLSSITRQGLPIVYVDSGSTDGSVGAARERGATVVELDMTQPFTAARARNAGFAALLEMVPTLEFVQFIDGDCLLEPGWIPVAALFLAEHPDIAVVCGRRSERAPHESVYNRLCDFEWDTPVGLTSACGGDALFRVEAFKAAGGFNSNLMAGEEPELCARLRADHWRVWRLDEPMTVHDAAMTHLSQWWLRSVRGGFGYAQVWSETRYLAVPLYRKETLRAALWGGILPSMAVIGCLVTPTAPLIAVLIFGLQVSRLAVRYDVRKASSWERGFFTMLAKGPEMQGGLKFLMSGAKTRSSITYK